MVGGIIPRSIASTVKTDSIAPAAPSVCPVIDLVELTADLRGALAENMLDRLGLGEIALRRRGAVRVDVVDLVRIEVAILRGTSCMHFAAPQSLGRGRGDVIGVALAA